MLSQHLVAAASGALIAGLRYTERDFWKIVRVIITGFGLSCFTASNAADAFNSVMPFHLEHKAAFFIIAVIGPELLDKVIYIIKTFRVSKQWK